MPTCVTYNCYSPSVSHFPVCHWCYMAYAVLLHAKTHRNQMISEQNSITAVNYRAVFPCIYSVILDLLLQKLIGCFHPLPGSVSWDYPEY